MNRPARCAWSFLAIQPPQFLVQKLGIDGYCRIPYDYLTKPHLASDFWAIQAVVMQ